MSFDKWYREVGYLGDDQNTRVKIAYEAGQQSKQAEVDGLQMKLSEDSRVLHNVIDIERKKCEELQKRIDDLTYKLNNIKNDALRGHHHDYDKGWRDCAITILNDLKGNTNDH